MRAGVALHHPEDHAAAAEAGRRHFKLYTDAVELFKKAVGKCNKSDAARGHLVLVPRVTISDHAVVARLAARFVGAYLADPREFAKPSRVCGVQYKPHWNGKPFQVAITDAVVDAFSSAPVLLRTVARTAGSAIEFYSEEELLKKYRRQRGKDPVAWQHMRIWATTDEIKAIPKAQKADRPVYAHREDFFDLFRATEKKDCPGFRSGCDSQRDGGRQG